MGISTQYVSVDITKKTASQIIRLGQGDKNGTTITARIYNDGAEYPMTGKTARFCMRTPDGKASYSVNNSSTSGNLVTFNINEQYAASVAGKTDVAYIEVLSGSTVICSTSRISVVIYRSASEGLPVSGAYSDALEEAIHSASTAASSANSAASNANTKATRAENAATAANNAADSVNAAKDAANTAASAANTAAGAANTAASEATSAKDAANAAATAANTAADSANAATSEANAAIEAMGDISELAVPEMTANVRGGAKVGGSTQVIGGKLEVKLSESATGTSVTTGSTSALRELQVHGRSMQDGTPTPDAPVPVQVVDGKNLLPLAAQTVTNRGVTATVDDTGTVTITGTATGGNAALTLNLATDIPLANNTDYTAHRITVSGTLDGTFYIRGVDDDNQTVHHLFNLASVTERTARFINNAIIQAVYIVISENTTIDCALHVQVEQGSTATPYVPYGCIALDIKGRNLTPFFSIPMGDTTYWQHETAPYTSNELGRVGFQGDDGWAHYVFDNSDRTTPAYVNMRCKYSWHNADSFMPNETYTIITEIKGLTGSGLAIRPVRSDQDTSIFVDSNMRNIGSDGTYSWTVQTKSDISQMEFVINGLMRVSAGNACSFDIRLSIVKGSVVLPYVPYNTLTCLIDSQGNTLASLPDGTRDELHVDSAGRVWIEKRTGRILTPTDVSNVNTLTQVTGGAMWNIDVDGLTSEEIPNGSTNGYCSHTPFCRKVALGSPGSHVFTFGDKVYYIIEGDFTASTAVTWVNSHQMTIIYPLATPQTIDLGYIDPPAIPSGSVVTVSASLTPTFELSCWTEHASEIADMPYARIPEFGDGLALDGDTLSVDLETANGAVTTGKIANNAITTDKIADNAISTDKIADDSITADKLDDKIILTEPSFRCVDRFIYGNINTNGVTSAQSGCVFTQDGIEYWAQILNSDTTNQDILVIRNIQNQQQVVSKTFELGHGYSLTYNPTTKQLMTENIEVSPAQIIIINVNTITNPYIEETIALGRTPLDNPFWYGNYIAGLQIAGGHHDIVVMNKNQTVIKRMPVDFYDTFHFGQGFVFQSAQYFEDTGEYYIGVTQGDGVIICEEINDNVVMKNYIPCKDYYSFIYMRELEFAYRNGDKLYINTYDEVDELLVPALLVWDMKHGTIQAENSWIIQHSGNIGFTVDYDNSSLIPGVSSTFKLAGDALRAARSCGHVGSVFIIFNSDYPHVFKLEGHEVTIKASSPRNIKGIHGVFSQLRIENAGNFTFETSILLSEPYYAGIYLRDSTLSISDTVIPNRDNNTTNHFTIIAEYSTCHLENVSASDLYIMCRRSALFLSSADQVSGILVRTFVSGVTSKNV